MNILGEQNRNTEQDLQTILRETNPDSDNLTEETIRIFKLIDFTIPTHCYDNSLKGNGELIRFTKTIPELIERAMDEDLVGCSREPSEIPNNEIIINVYCLLCDIPAPTWGFAMRNPTTVFKTDMFK